MSKDTQIGELDVSKNENANIVQIEVESNVHVKLFIDVDFKYKLNCTYKNDVLIYSAVTTYVNGRVHSTSTTEKTGDSYTVTKNSHTSKFMKNITFSGALLYFTEPKNIKELFSEFDNIDKPIHKIANHAYQIVNPSDGRLSEYYYKNGVLERTTNHHKFLTFTLIKN